MGPISETYRYIIRSAGVRSGNAIVEGTRIAVHDVIGLLQNGETVETISANCFTYDPWGNGMFEFSGEFEINAFGGIKFVKHQVVSRSMLDFAIGGTFGDGAGHSSRWTTGQRIGAKESAAVTECARPRG